MISKVSGVFVVLLLAALLSEHLAAWWTLERFFLALRISAVFGVIAFIVGVLRGRKGSKNFSKPFRGFGFAVDVVDDTIEKAFAERIADHLRQLLFDSGAVMNVPSIALRIEIQDVRHRDSVVGGASAFEWEIWFSVEIAMTTFRSVHIAMPTFFRRPTDGLLKDLARGVFNHLELVRVRGERYIRWRSQESRMGLVERSSSMTSSP